MAIIPFTHDTPEWHAMRAKNVGASEVANLFLGREDMPTYMPGKYALYHIKAGNAPSLGVGGERIRFGLKFEPVIAECAAEDCGWALRKGGYATDDLCPGLASSLDYEVDPGPEELSRGWTGPGALECKNTDWLQHKRTWTDDEPPLHIGLQLQAQMACTGYTWGAVAGLIGGNDLRIYRYPAKPTLIAEIRRRVTAFWKSIAEGREPPTDGSDAAAAVIRAMYPGVLDQELDLTSDNEGPDLCARMLHAAAARKKAEAEEAECKNAIMARAGEHKRVLFRGYRVSMVVRGDTPDRPAKPDEIIKGRRGSRHPTVKELSA